MCDWLYQEGACAVRAAMARHVMQLCHEASDVVRELERRQGVQPETLDLFAPPPVDPAVIEFWRSVHRACCHEYRRLSRLFWQRCQHPYVYRPLEVAS